MQGAGVRLINDRLNAALRGDAESAAAAKAQLRPLGAVPPAETGAVLHGAWGVSTPRPAGHAEDGPGLSAVVSNASSGCAAPEAKPGVSGAGRRTGGRWDRRCRRGDLPFSQSCVPIAAVNGRASVSFQPSLVGELMCRC